MAGRLDAAIASFRTVLSLAPGRGGAHAELGNALLLKGDAQGALAEIEQETSEIWKMIGLPMAYHALGRKADSDAALAALIAKYEKDCALQHRLRLRLPRRGRQGVRVARQGGRVRRPRPRRDRDGEPVRQDPRRPALAAVPAQDRQGAGATGEDRVQGDAAAMSMQAYLHGLRGMGLILNLRYPQPARRGG